MSSREGRGSGGSVRGGGGGARCGGSADAVYHCCVTDTLLRSWAGSSYGGHGMARASSSGTVGRAEMASNSCLWPGRVLGLRKDRAASVSGFGLSGGFRSFLFHQQQYSGVLVTGKY